MQLQSLGEEDLLKKKMATHSSILAWEIPWTEKPDGLQSMGLQKSRIQLSDQNNNVNKCTNKDVKVVTRKYFNCGKCLQLSPKDTVGLLGTDFPGSPTWTVEPSIYS